MLELTTGHIEKLCKLNLFSVPTKGMIFIGLRGVSPVNSDDFEFNSKQKLFINPVDYNYPRCTFIQWLPLENKLSVYAGSTVPHQRYVKKSINRLGFGANQLMTGYYKDYRKGKHKAGSLTGHDAFRQIHAQPIRRTADDLDYDGDDRIEFTNPYDNIHAAWSMGINHNYFGSAGCQVIVGYPKCEKREFRSDSGPWSVFKKNAYDDNQDQDSFPYVLLDGSSIQRIIMHGHKGMIRLRYGSSGQLVGAVQSVLQEQGYYEGRIDDYFLERTLRAVTKFQEKVFGEFADDGIVGPLTAEALDIEWPDEWII